MRNAGNPDTDLIGEAEFSSWKEGVVKYVEKKQRHASEEQSQEETGNYENVQRTDEGPNLDEMGIRKGRVKDLVGVYSAKSERPEPGSLQNTQPEEPVLKMPTSGRLADYLKYFEEKNINQQIKALDEEYATLMGETPAQLEDLVKHETGRTGEVLDARAAVVDLLKGVGGIAGLTGNEENTAWCY